MHIRPIESRDNAEWMRMRATLWPDVSAKEHRAEMAKLLRDNSTAVFVADRGDGRLGGFVEAGTRSHADGCKTSPVGYVEGWYVDADLRRQGVGRALIEAAENWARLRGHAEMASDCLIDNEVSFRSHIRLGYREVDRMISFFKPLGGKKHEQ